jgi:aminopeptidase-like protein
MIYFKEYPMLKWAKDLFPICRFLTGLGTLKTINYFKKFILNLE